VTEEDPEEDFPVHLSSDAAPDPGLPRPSIQVQARCGPTLLEPRCRLQLRVS